MTRVGQIGLGYWGKNIFRNFCELGVLASAYDASPEVLSARTSASPFVRQASSVDDILGDGTVDAVALATPAATHFDLARRSLLAGKDVFVEKPLALTTQEGEELLRIAEENRRILMVGHILQYHPAVRELKKILEDGLLGEIEYIYSNRLNIGKLRTEENILWSFAPHDISVILSLVGEEPSNVNAFGGDYVTPGIYDTTVTMIEFPRGVRAHIFVSWLHPYKEQKLIVVGSKAMAVFDDVSEEKLFLYPHKIEWENKTIPVAHRADYRVIPVPPGEPLRLELQCFLDSILTRQTPPTDGREGLAVLRVLGAAEQSLQKRRIS